MWQDKEDCQDRGLPYQNGLFYEMVRELISDKQREVVPHRKLGYLAICG